MRRGQVMALFILFGVMFLFLIGFFVALKSMSRGENIERMASLATGTSSFQSHVEQCLRQEVLAAVDRYGVLSGQEEYIARHVQSALPGCIDLRVYEQAGWDISAGVPKASVQLSPEVLAVDVEYPLSGRGPSGEFSLDQFEFSLPRASSAELRFNSDGQLPDDVSIPSSDGDAELILPKGASITDSSGSPVRELSLRVLERDFNGLDNPLVVGMVAYEVQPDARFSSPVTLKVQYRDEDVPRGVDERSLTLGHWDTSRGIWRSRPTEVDTRKNTLTARFSHFSPVAPVMRCRAAATEVEYYVFPMRHFPLFEQACGTATECAAAKFTADSLNNYFETGFVADLIPVRDLPLLPGADEPDGYVPPTPKPLLQRPLTPCMLRDWDHDDQELTQDKKVDRDDSQCSELTDPADEQECREAVQDEDVPDCMYYDAGRGDYGDYSKRLERSAEQDDGVQDHTPGDSLGSPVQGCFCTVKATVSGESFDVRTRCSALGATAPSSGYDALSGIPAQGLPSGMGAVRFRVNSDGGGCIAEDSSGKLVVKVRLSTTPGDTATYAFNPEGIFPESDALSIWNSLPADDGLTSGKERIYSKRFNTLYAGVENTNGDACAGLWLEHLGIAGVGIHYEVPLAEETEDCTVTVQKRINYLCGCDGNCNDADWGGELGRLVNWRGSWSVEAESVAAGQVKLCDLDLTDPLLSGLADLGWSPYGGDCEGDIPIVIIEEGEACTREGAAACDFAGNRVMRCSASAEDERDVPEGTGYATAENTPNALSWTPKRSCGEQVCSYVGGTAVCVDQRRNYEEVPLSCSPVGTFQVFNSLCHRCEQIAQALSWVEHVELDPATECREERLESALCEGSCTTRRDCAGTIDEGPASEECDQNGLGEVCCESGDIPGGCAGGTGACRRGSCAGGINIPEGNGECNTIPGEQWVCCGGSDEEPSSSCPSPRTCLSPYQCSEREYVIGSGDCTDDRECCGPSTGGTVAGCVAAGGRCYLKSTCRAEGWPSLSDGGACSTSMGVLYDCCKPAERDPCAALRCVDITREGEDTVEWQRKCGQNACGLDCENRGDWCVPTGMTACVPDEIGEAGAPGDLEWVEPTCWLCGQGGWQPTSATSCGCARYGRTFRVGDVSWFDDEKCYSCEGFNEWDLAPGRCDGTCLIWVGNWNNGLYYRVEPGDRLCTVDEKVSRCAVENGRPVDRDDGPCRMGCRSGTLNPDCVCARDQCPACPLTNQVPRAGEIGDTYLSPAPQSSCFACTDSGTGPRWMPGSSNCWCPSNSGPRRAGQEERDTVWSDGTCWICERDGSLVWKEVSADSCPESSCTSAASVRVPYQQWVCEAALGGLYNLKQCLGENRWGAVQECVQGCDPGSVFSSAEQASC